MQKEILKTLNQIEASSTPANPAPELGGSLRRILITTFVTSISAQLKPI